MSRAPIAIPDNKPAPLHENSRRASDQSHAHSLRYATIFSKSERALTIQPFCTAKTTRRQNVILYQGEPSHYAKIANGMLFAFVARLTESELQHAYPADVLCITPDNPITIHQRNQADAYGAARFTVPAPRIALIGLSSVR